MVVFHTRASNRVIPWAIRPSGYWRALTWRCEVPGDQMVECGRSTSPIFPRMSEGRVPSAL